MTCCAGDECEGRPATLQWSWSKGKKINQLVNYLPCGYFENTHSELIKGYFSQDINLREKKSWDRSTLVIKDSLDSLTLHPLK